MTDNLQENVAPDWEVLEALAARLIPALAEKGLKLATAESCTGGLLCGLLTGVAGASSVVDRGFVTYSNEAKQDLLGVTKESLKAYGAVSPQVACEMAAGALKNSLADITLSITGIAGPDGGSAEKPVGTVYFGLATRDTQAKASLSLFSGLDRKGVRHASLAQALQIISNCI